MASSDPDVIALDTGSALIEWWNDITANSTKISVHCFPASEIIGILCPLYQFVNRLPVYPEEYILTGQF